MDLPSSGQIIVPVQPSKGRGNDPVVNLYHIALPACDRRFGLHPRVFWVFIVTAAASLGVRQKGGLNEKPGTRDGGKTTKERPRPKRDQIPIAASPAEKNSYWTRVLLHTCRWAFQVAKKG